MEIKDIKDVLTGMGGNWVGNLGALQAAMNGTEPGCWEVGKGLLASLLLATAHGRFQ